MLPGARQAAAAFWHVGRLRSVDGSLEAEKWRLLNDVEDVLRTLGSATGQKDSRNVWVVLFGGFINP